MSRKCRSPEVLKQFNVQRRDVVTKIHAVTDSIVATKSSGLKARKIVGMTSMFVKRKVVGAKNSRKYGEGETGDEKGRTQT